MKNPEWVVKDLEKQLHQLETKVPIKIWRQQFSIRATVISIVLYILYRNEREAIPLTIIATIGGVLMSLMHFLNTRGAKKENAKCADEILKIVNEVDSQLGPLATRKIMFNYPGAKFVIEDRQLQLEENKRSTQGFSV